MEKCAAWLKATLNFEFARGEYLKQALTHRSASGGNNERLEFLGDAVLDTVISEIVFEACPDAPEGDLSRLRSFLVKESALNDVATELGVGQWIILGPGEKKSGGHRRASILADALEALFGAVYLDAGFDAAAAVIRTAYGSRIDNMPEPEELRDPKTRLQEYLQAQRRSLPSYEIREISGKAHKQKFSVACRIAELDLDTLGTGRSKREAEQVAARKMLAQIEDSAA